MENKKQAVIYLCEEVARLRNELRLVTDSRLAVIEQSEERRETIWNLKNKTMINAEALEAVNNRLFIIRCILMSAIDIELIDDDSERIDLEELVAMAATALAEKNSHDLIDITPIKP